MNEERHRILNMVAEGKITPAEAEKLLEALGKTDSSTTMSASTANPKFLRVLVDGGKAQEHGGGKVNIRIPMNLIRAGVRLAALLPAVAYEQINKAMKQNGFDFDITQIKPENLEELVQHLGELSVDVEGGEGEKVRVFCE